METPDINDQTKPFQLKLKQKKTDFDKTIEAMHDYITSASHNSLYRTVFSKEQIDSMREIRRSDIRKRRFKKWFIMSSTKKSLKSAKKLPTARAIESISKSKICSSLCLGSTSFMSTYSFINDDQVKSDINPQATKCEKNLRDFYSKNKEVFRLRVFKSPPEVFRRYAWFTGANLPLNRSDSVYNSLLLQSLDEEIESQINKDISRTMEERPVHLPHLQEPLFRVLKALALIDKELSYCQGMNFIVGFILILLQGNEVEAFYLSVALFSHSYSNSFGIRGFYLEDFPLLDLYMFIFDYHFAKKMPKLNSKLKSFEIPSHSWVGKWFQTLFVNTFPEGIVVRIWDGVLAFGIPFIISIALSIISHLEQQLMALDDLADFASLFKSISKQHRTGETQAKSRMSSKSKLIHFDIEDIMKKAKAKFYLSDEDMKDMIAIYFEKHSEGENDDDEEEKLNKVMNCINTKVEYELDKLEFDHTLSESLKKNEALYETVKEEMNVNDNPFIDCVKSNIKERIDTVYDADINEFYLNTIESKGKKFSKPFLTKHLFKNPFVSELII